jgi:protocatechuate 3,4-dioxygenase beta subunit
MDNDDRQVGRILRRREVLALLGAGGAAALAAGPLARIVNARTATATIAPEVAAGTLAQTTTAASCVVKPELTEGPYFVDENLNRSDIRVEQLDGSIKDGVPLGLVFNVSQIAGGSCAAVSGAKVDVWHCDALGVYSDVNDRSFPNSTLGQSFLRGYQLTADDGSARFTTIYPGWYAGRAVHIHFKIRTTSTTGEPYEFTSQLFLDDALTDQVHAQQPYASKGQRNMRNAQDGIYREGGDQLLLNAIATETGGYTGTFPIALDLSDAAVGASDHNTAGPGGQGSPGGSGGRPPGPPPGRP